MIITFNGVVIAREPAQGGFDAISDFGLSGKGKSQVRPRLRAQWAALSARGNRVHTLTGLILLAPAPTLDAALLSRHVTYTNLPDEGDLIFQEVAQIVTYPGALLDAFETYKDAKGVSVGYRFTFLAGAANPSGPAAANALLNQDGTVLLNQDGTPLLKT